MFSFPVKTPLHLGITLGDVNGIGPEVALKAVYGRRWPAGTHLVLVGSARVARAVAESLRFPAPPPWDPRDGRSPGRKVVTWDPVPNVKPRYRPGGPAVSASRAAALWIRAATEACLQRRLDALVTAPISKEGLSRAGLGLPGHTEYLADLTGTKRFAMMLIGGPLRVVLATRHLPLREVPEALTRRAVREAVMLAAESLPWLGCRQGRLAVCGLNPHAGDGGVLGDEERRVIAPALADARRRGVHAVGPLAADAVFYQAAQGRYDAVVAMYHDQGLGPLKTLAFDRGVNVTLGLPIVRTSPDHGTAFDIAGRGVADPASMVEALRLAHHLAARRNPWYSPPARGKEHGPGGRSDQ